MAELKPSEIHIPPQAFDRVVHQGERVRIDRRGGKGIYLINEDDLKRLEGLDELEEELDRRAVLESRDEPDGISLEAYRAKLAREGR